MKFVVRCCRCRWRWGRRVRSSNCIRYILEIILLFCSRIVVYSHALQTSTLLSRSGSSSSSTDDNINIFGCSSVRLYTVNTITTCGGIRSLRIAAFHASWVDTMCVKQEFSFKRRERFEGQIYRHEMARGCSRVHHESACVPFSDLAKKWEIDSYELMFFRDSSIHSSLKNTSGIKRFFTSFSIMYLLGLKNTIRLTRFYSHAPIYKIIASTWCPDFGHPSQALYVMLFISKTSRL